MVLLCSASCHCPCLCVERTVLSRSVPSQALSHLPYVPIAAKYHLIRLNKL